MISEYNAVKFGYRDITRIIKKVLKNIEEKIPGIVFSSEENTGTSSNQFSISTQSSRQCRNSKPSNVVNPEKVEKSAREGIERLINKEKDVFKKLDNYTKKFLEHTLFINFIKFILDIYNDAIDGILSNKNSGSDPCKQIEDAVYREYEAVRSPNVESEYMIKMYNKYSKHQFSKDDLATLRQLLKDNKSLKRIVDMITEYFQTMK